jgi:hypothetical protein
MIRKKRERATRARRTAFALALSNHYAKPDPSPERAIPKAQSGRTWLEENDPKRKFNKLKARAKDKRDEAWAKRNPELKAQYAKAFHLT